MYAFARRPKWILSHLFVLALVVAMIGAGFWQLDRLQQKKDRNDLVEQRLDEPVAPVEEVVRADQSTDEGADVRFRRVTATGTYLVDEQVLVRNRTFDGAPGSWLLTPLLLDDGSALVVNRGWVPVTADQPIPTEATPPTGEVAVEGLLEESQTRGSFGPTDRSGEDLATLSRVDLDRLQEQVDEDLYPVWLQLEAQDPAQGDRPTMLDPPDLSEGPHLGYAGQWFTFALIALIGYPLILRRRARQGEPEDLPA